MRSSARRPALSLLVVALLTLAGCSSGEPDAEPAPTPSSTPTPTPTGLSASAWADNVCGALGDLTTDIRSVADGLSVQLGGGDALDQLKSQLTTNAAKAGQSLEDLKTAVGDAPDTEEATALKESLQSSWSDMTSSTQDARQAAQDAADSANAAEFLGSAGTALSETSAALAAAEAYATTLLAAASGARGSVRSAFADAESCAALQQSS
ncbi:hypothetical protein [Cellulomonas sp. URHE0023]|uniref:hypothetical protein n=1 Tax=Cellulomonas sp. URHE0023 TaxID=1380354 RepID=UPI0004889264|nr:hypothetical protein [Cellulomonas sp. URHE0023]